MDMNITLRTAVLEDMDILRSYDQHISPEALRDAAQQERCFIICADNAAVGVMRYGLFWDSIPFLNLIYLDDTRRRQGIGRQAMGLWEQRMREAGHGMVMLSTQSDEDSQHFYRSLGYRESGCIMMDIPGYEQPMEIIFTKAL